MRDQAIHAKRPEPEASQEGNHASRLADLATEQGSATLLQRLNAEFAALSDRARIPFDDARLLLMNGRDSL